MLRADGKFIMTIYKGKPEGRRPLGRPKLRSLDGIRNKLRILGDEKAWQERENIMKEAKNKAMNPLSLEWPAWLCKV